MATKLYGTIDGYDLKKMDFSGIDPRKFFPDKKLDRYDWRHPRFKRATRDGLKCLIVTMDNLTVDPICDCLDATIDAVWQGAGALEYVGTDTVDESAGDVSIESAIRLGCQTNKSVIVTFVHRGQSRVLKGTVFNGPDNEIRIVTGQAVDTWIPRAAVRSITLESANV
jgi:hypothetical protein